MNLLKYNNLDYQIIFLQISKNLGNHWTWALCILICHFLVGKGSVRIWLFQKLIPNILEQGDLEFRASSKVKVEWCHRITNSYTLSLQHRPSGSLVCFTDPAYILIYLTISWVFGPLLQNGDKITLWIAWCFISVHTLRCKGLKKSFCVLLLLFFTGVTKQLFPNTDDVSIRRMIGQKLNNCTKKPNLSKNLNSQDIK